MLVQLASLLPQRLPHPGRVALPRWDRDRLVVLSEPLVVLRIVTIALRHGHIMT